MEWTFDVVMLRDHNGLKKWDIVSCFARNKDLEFLFDFAWDHDTKIGAIPCGLARLAWKKVKMTLSIVENGKTKDLIILNSAGPDVNLQDTIRTFAFTFCKWDNEKAIELIRTAIENLKKIDEKL